MLSWQNLIREWSSAEETNRIEITFVGDLRYKHAEKHEHNSFYGEISSRKWKYKKECRASPLERRQAQPSVKSHRKFVPLCWIIQTTVIQNVLWRENSFFLRDICHSCASHGDFTFWVWENFYEKFCFHFWFLDSHFFIMWRSASSKIFKFFTDLIVENYFRITSCHFILSLFWEDKKILHLNIFLFVLFCARIKLQRVQLSSIVNTELKQTQC